MTSAPAASPIDRLRALAGTQGGMVATRQAVELGFTPAAFAHLKSRGDITVVRRGVWRLAGTSSEPDATIAAWLACYPYGVVSHASAGVRHGIRGVAVPTLPEVTVPHGQTRAPAEVTVHRTRRLDDIDVVTLDGMRWTSRPRTVCDLAEPHDEWATLRTLDDAIAAGLPRTAIHRRASDLLPGRPELLPLIVATRPGAAEVFRSILERVAADVYRAGALPEPEWNVEVRDEDGRIGIVDSLWRPWSVISEVEGLRFHTSPAQRRKDAGRFNRLGDAHRVRRFTYEDV